MTIQLYFTDLQPSAQASLLEAFNISEARDMNWDVFPLFEMLVAEEDAVHAAVAPVYFTPN